MNSWTDLGPSRHSYKSFAGSGFTKASDSPTKCKRSSWMSSTPPENRAYFLEYKHTLEARFDQIVIYIRSYPVDIL